MCAGGARTGLTRGFWRSAPAECRRCAGAVQLVAEHDRVGESVISSDGEGSLSERSGFSYTLDRFHPFEGSGEDHASVERTPGVFTVDEHIGGLVANGANELFYKGAEQGLLEQDQEDENADSKAQQHETPAATANLPEGESEAAHVRVDRTDGGTMSPKLLRAA